MAHLWKIALTGGKVVSSLCHAWCNVTIFVGKTKFIQTIVEGVARNNVFTIWIRDVEAVKFLLLRFQLLLVFHATEFGFLFQTFGIFCFRLPAPNKKLSLPSFLPLPVSFIKVLRFHNNLTASSASGSLLSMKKLIVFSVKKNGQVYFVSYFIWPCGCRFYSIFIIIIVTFYPNGCSQFWKSEASD